MLAIVPGHTFLPHGHQQFSVVGEFHHLVHLRVGNPNVVVRVHPQAVGHPEKIFSPGSHLLSRGAVENQDCR
jgi:hypothetical protein